MGIEKSTNPEAAQNHSILDYVHNWRRLLVLFLVLFPGVSPKEESVNHSIGKNTDIADSQIIVETKNEYEIEDHKPPRYPGPNFVVF